VVGRLITSADIGISAGFFSWVSDHWRTSVGLWIEWADFYPTFTRYRPHSQRQPLKWTSSSLRLPIFSRLVTARVRLTRRSVHWLQMSICLFYWDSALYKKLYGCGRSTTSPVDAFFSHCFKLAVHNLTEIQDCAYGLSQVRLHFLAPVIDGNCMLISNLLDFPAPASA
jgi:hypothetical protein